MTVGLLGWPLPGTRQHALLTMARVPSVREWSEHGQGAFSQGVIWTMLLWDRVSCHHCLLRRSWFIAANNAFHMAEIDQRFNEMEGNLQSNINSKSLKILRIFWAYCLKIEVRAFPNKCATPLLKVWFGGAEGLACTDLGASTPSVWTEIYI